MSSSSFIYTLLISLLFIGCSAERSYVEHSESQEVKVKSQQEKVSSISIKHKSSECPEELSGEFCSESEDDKKTCVRLRLEKDELSNLQFVKGRDQVIFVDGTPQMLESSIGEFITTAYCQASKLYVDVVGPEKTYSSIYSVSEDGAQMNELVLNSDNTVFLDKTFDRAGI